jgi:hypothetical protein
MPALCERDPKAPSRRSSFSPIRSNFPPGNTFPVFHVSGIGSASSTTPATARKIHADRGDRNSKPGSLVTIVPAAHVAVYTYQCAKGHQSEFTASDKWPPWFSSL